MTVGVTIGGATVDPEAILLNGGLQALTSQADGGVASGTAVIDDPAGIYDFLELQQFVVTETDCPTFYQRSFTGYIYGITTSRGPYRTGAGRIHTMTIGDLNFLLHLEPLYGAGAIRPKESGTARLAWLMTTPGMTGVVFDNGLITPNAAVFGPEDYRGQYHDEVLQSICVAGLGSRIFFLAWMESADPGEEITLFYAEPQAVLRVSTLQVSNILANTDAVTFPPYEDAELEQQGEEIYCGLWLTYGGAGNRLFTHNDTTHATYFASSEPPGLHRIGTLDLPRVGELDTAQHHSDAWLNVHSGSLDTLSYTLRLPSDKVNLVNAGMLLPSELSHLMGYETAATPRINERTISLTPDTNKFYDCVLKLSLNGAPIIGGGGGEPFPFEPDCSPASMGLVQPIVQGGPTSVTMGQTGTVGNTWLWLVAGRTNGAFVPDTGTWTQRQSQACNQNVAGDYPIKAYTKPVAAGDQTWSIVVNKTTDSKYWMAEVPGDFDLAVGASPGASVNPLISITPTAGKVALLISFADLSTDDALYSLAPTTGMTEIADDHALGPKCAINTRIVDGTTGSYSVGSTILPGASPFANVAVIGLSFICSGDSEPPGTGQEVPGEFVALGDGTTTAFHTHFPYAAGSLKVWVDGHPILLGLTETDPTTGAFTLDFAPLGANGDSPAERVTATYQAGAQPLQSRSTLTSANTKTDLLTKIADLSIDVIELAAGNYDWQNVVITTDRTSAPLIIRPALGATVNFVGPATTTGIIFQIGSSAANKAKWITFDGHDSAGGGAMVFKDFLLAQSGVFEPRSSDHCSFVNLTFDNIGQDTAVPGHAAFKSWIFYISGAGGGSNDHLLIDSCHLLPPLLNRDISAFQIASSGSHGAISITNIDMAEYHYALYDERPTTNLVASDWTMSDTGHSSGPSSIRITGAVSIAGLYSNIVATSSDPLDDDHSGGGVFVDGGGNSGI